MAVALAAASSGKHGQEVRVTRVWFAETACGVSEREGNVGSGCDQPRNRPFTTTVARKEPAMFLTPR